ncbi:hypothetical protein ENKNEFLB_02871 [Nocardioides aquaticus]|jgi:uncharacterized membrane protein|uniref:Uncharacterized protein n=1 Tax=Nocardioides aquaticus TaxID=160826 RepID=A0ABX8EIW2_9ACTN|nr:hypothetical protein [Nocardioides aquaticus]QVT80472.1 hypothetical protein ENKNEFLB_02871 [Nocardioides aquaticus]
MKSTKLFVVSLLGLAVSAAVLILLIPSLFGSGEHADTWLVVGLALVAAAFAVGTRYWRPPTRTSESR